MSRLRAVATAVHAEMPTTVQFEVGARHLRTNPDTPLPYVVWVHADVKHTDSTHVGPQSRGDGTEGKTFLTRSLQVDVHVWHTDEDEAEDLVEELLAGAYNCFSKHSCRFGGEKWPKQEKHQYAQRGEPVIVRLEIDVPVDSVAHETVEILSQDPPAVKAFVEEL